MLSLFYLVVRALVRLLVSGVQRGRDDGLKDLEILVLRHHLADPPWRFINKTGKVAPEHKRLHRYTTMTVQEICDLPVQGYADEPCTCTSGSRRRS